MKKIITALFIFATFISSAQTVEVKWGKDFDKDGTKEDLKGDARVPVNADKDGNIVYVSPSVFAKCKEVYKLPDNKYSSVFVQTQNHFYAITEAPGKVYAIEVDEKGNLKNRPVEIASFNLQLDPKTKWIYYTNGDYRECLVSQNRRTLGTWTEYDNAKKNGFEKLAFSVCDENLKPLWSKEHEFKMLESQIRIKKKQVSNSGKIVFSALLAKEKQGKNILPNYYRLFVADANGLKSAQLDLGDGVDALTLNMIDIDDDNMLVTGGYTTTAEAEQTHGIFAAVLNLSSVSFTSQHITPFTNEVLQALGSSKSRSIEALSTELLIRSETGNYFVMMEGDKFLCGNNGCMELRKGMIVINLNKDLKCLSQTPVMNEYRKNQGTYFGTFPYIINDKLVLFYNQNTESRKESRMKYTSLNFEGKITGHGDVPLSDERYFYSGEPYPNLRLKDGRLIIGCSAFNGNGHTPIFCRGVLTIH